MSVSRVSTNLPSTKDDDDDDHDDDATVDADDTASAAVVDDDDGVGSGLHALRICHGQEGVPSGFRCI